MKQFGKIILLAVGFGVLALALSSLPHQTAIAAGGAPVVVQNFPSVQPVSGTVNVANFPTLVATSVSNSSPAPLYVRDVDNPAHHPLVLTAQCTILSGATSCEGDTTGTPSFKEYVIETVSGVVGVDKGLDATLAVIITTSGSVQSYHLPLLHSRTDGGTDEYVTSAPNIRLYADGAGLISVSVARNASTTQTAQGSVVFSGYTVTCGAFINCPLP